MKIWIKIKEKRCVVCCVLLAIVCLCGLGFRMENNIQTMSRSRKINIVVDCGHGGIDPGKVGVNGVYEKDINLAIGKYLKQSLEKKGFYVIMTRESDTGLYQDSDQSKKIADLQKRVEMMNQNQVNLIVSIHQNSFTGQSSRGAQVFYQTNSVEGEKLAKILQSQLISSLDTKNHRQAKANSEYYLLKKTKKTAVIVECGFLSNYEEAHKLCDKRYQRQIAWAITQGIMRYTDLTKK